MLIDYKYEEYYQKYFSMKSYVDSKLNDLELVINTLTDMIATTLSKIDEKKLNGLVDKIKNK